MITRDLLIATGYSGHQHSAALRQYVDLVGTAIRHRWKTNSDEPDVINAAMDVLATLAEK